MKACISVFLASCSVWPLLAGAEALDWLQRMNDAVRQTTYEGVAVYRTGDQLETLRVYHRNHNGEELERIVSLSGDPREVRRDQDKVTCILPEQEAVVVDHKGLQGLLPNLSRSAFEQLKDHYELRTVGQARIAGRNCRGIEVRSRDAFRYSYRIWIDEVTSLPLSVNLIGQKDEILEQIVFTQINYPDELPDKVFYTGVNTRGFRQLIQNNDDPDAQDTVGDWEVSSIPRGFRLATRSLQRLPGTGRSITHLLFTDGLAAVSVFTTPNAIPDNEAFQGMSKMGGVSAYGRMVGDYHITVVGEVPQATVRHFGDHTKRVQPQR